MAFEESVPRFLSTVFNSLENSKGFSTFSCTSSTTESGGPIRTLNVLLPDSASKSWT